jgi:hypothetical protein
MRRGSVASTRMGRVELVADPNAQDDDSHGRSTLADATDPVGVRPGAIPVAGNHHGHADARVLSNNADGQVHFEILRFASEREARTEREHDSSRRPPTDANDSGPHGCPHER